MSRMKTDDNSSSSRFPIFTPRTTLDDPDSALSKRLHALEAKQRNSMNRLQQRVLGIKEELKRLDREKHAHSADSSDRDENGMKHVEHESQSFKLGDVSSLMTARQRWNVNQRSFENLRSKLHEKREQEREALRYRIQYVLVESASDIPKGFPMIKTNLLSKQSEEKTSNMASLQLPEIVQRQKSAENKTEEQANDQEDAVDLSYLGANTALKLPSLSSQGFRSFKRSYEIIPEEETETNKKKGRQNDPATIKAAMNAIQACRYIRGKDEPEYMQHESNISDYIFGGQKK